MCLLSITVSLNFFETVFSSKPDTRALDNIYDEIFQDSRDWYYEEEDEYSKLFYLPPPLHEVRLIDPDRCDLREKLM